jgi:CDP-diacylglycerol--serine O-phosphatidyltransferase
MAQKQFSRHIPNILTVLNLFCGSVSIMLAMQGNLLLSAYLLLIAFHFDIFDGLSARLLNVSSDLGKELDSLADVVSFGLGPASILHAMLRPELGISEYSIRTLEVNDILGLIPFILPVFAALRLAKFNLMETGSNFSGMPTPANALMVMSVPLIANHHPDSFLVGWFNYPAVIIGYSIMASMLMIAPIPLYPFKLKGLSWTVNKYTYIFLIGLVVLLIIFGYSGLFLSVVYFLISGFILALLLKRKNRLINP